MTYAQSAAPETAFDRITKTNTLRCGYAIATPWLMMDMSTNKLTGVDVDVIDLIAKKIGLKIDWVEETGWGTAEQGLFDRSLRYALRQRLYRSTPQPCCDLFHAVFAYSDHGHRAC